MLKMNVKRQCRDWHGTIYTFFNSSKISLFFFFFSFLVTRLPLKIITNNSRIMLFTDLPNEIHYSFINYFSIYDIVALSQTSNRFRDFYAPISWKRCEVIEATYDRMEVCWSSFSTEMRHPSAGLLNNPEKYKWFLNEHVEVLVFHPATLHRDEHMNYWFEKFSTTYKEFYPKLKKIEIVDDRLWNTHTRFDLIRSGAFFSSPLFEMTLIVGSAVENLIKDVRPIPGIGNTSLDTIHDYTPMKKEARNLIISAYDYESTIIPDSPNLGDHRFHTIEVSVYTPDQFLATMDHLKKLKSCDNLIVLVPVTSRSGGFRTTTILSCLDKVPKAVKEISLKFEVIPFSLDDSGASPTYYFLDDLISLHGKLVLDRVTSFRGFWFGMSSIFDLASFPNLCQLYHLDNSNGILSVNISPMRSFLIMHCTEVFESITLLEWYIEKDMHLYQFISHFTNLKHFSISTRQVNSRKWSNYDAFLEYITNPKKNKFHTTQDISKYVRAIEPSFIQWVQQVAQEVIDDLEFKETPLDESENLDSQYPEMRNIDFLDCFNTQLVFFAMTSLPCLKSVKIQCNRSFLVYPLLYSGLRLLRKSKSLRYLSILLGFSALLGEGDSGIRIGPKYGVDGEFLKVLNNRPIEGPCRYEMLDSKKIAHRMITLNFKEHVALLHEYFANQKENWSF